MTGDISAILFDPRQAYTSVRLQQGRVITDLDWNENARIEADRRRRMLADLVCGHGSSNDGFRVRAAAPADATVAGANGDQTVATFDVQLAGGSFLLGGELQRWAEGDAETFLGQRDWLQLTGSDQGELPAAPANERTDLVYLEAVERPVTAVEDRELRERALGGPDTSTRMKALRRIRVLENAPTGCSAAAAALQDLVTAPRPGDTSGVAHGFDPVACEVLSKARLTVDFTGPGPSGDLCAPRVTEGYLGAENQAIRVQLTRANRFVWAYDNAAPLYRVQVTDATPAGDGSIEVTLLTPPNDPALFPLEEMVVEILPWEGVLANREKTATVAGHLARVTAAYDPGFGTIRIAPEVPAATQAWLASAERDPILSPRDPEDEQRFFFMRVWRPGPEESADLDHSFLPGADVALPGTGLAVNFSAFGIPGDFWVIAARPNTPDRVVPWRLLDADAPMGPHRFVAPLGLLDWRTENDELVADARDCRHRFRKLCDIETCCTVHVGDGDASNGDVQDLQAAIDLLPDEGGRICLLPGRHLAAALIADGRDIAIEGCGPRSVLVAADGQTAPLVTIARSQRITLRDFATESASTQHVLARNAEDVVLEQLEMRARDRGAVLGTAVDGMRVERCAIRTAPLDRTLLGQNAPIEPAVFLAGARLVVRRSLIETEEGDGPLTALGGLQIGGDSMTVDIVENVIRGGAGAGVVLGSIDFQPAATVNSFELLREYYAVHVALPTYSSWLTLGEDGCIHLDPRPNPPGNDGDGNPLQPVSDGPVVDCRIRDNRILDMGGSGVTAAFWFDPDAETDAIVTDDIAIDGNLIRNCMRLSTTGVSDDLRQISAFGGITLAVGSEIRIRDNRITDLATTHPSPIVGVFVLDGSAIAIQRNHLRDNGMIATLESDIALGLAGGVMVAMARPGFDFIDVSIFQSQTAARQDGAAACVVEDNTIVAREGRALTVIGVGPIMVHGNRLTAHGSNILGRIPIVGATASAFNLQPLAAVGLLNVRQIRNPLLAALDVLGGGAVAVLNLGLSNEVYLQLLGFSGLGLVDPPQQDDGFLDDDISLLANGNIMLNDNQIVFADNQCDCDLGFDFVGVNAAAIGWSVRMQGNRMKEGILNAFLSGMTVGLLNDTSHNQGSHCFAVAGAKQPEVVGIGLPSGASVELNTNTHLVPESFCEPFGAAAPQLNASVGLRRQATFGRSA